MQQLWYAQLCMLLNSMDAILDSPLHDDVLYSGSGHGSDDASSVCALNTSLINLFSPRRLQSRYIVIV